MNETRKCTGEGCRVKIDCFRYTSVSTTAPVFDSPVLCRNGCDAYIPNQRMLPLDPETT